MANSNTELYAYRYIVELYDTGDSVNLSKELSQFQARYPDSAYIPYVKFMEANLSLEAGDYLKAISQYEALLDKNLRQDVMGELLLNYSLCLSGTGNYSGAMHILQRIDSEIADPDFSAQANLQRADIYYAQGQYYSAERLYKESYSLLSTDSELAYALFNTYIKLNKDAEALVLLTSQDTSSDIYLRFVQSWLEYLLANERYDEFSDFLATQVPVSVANSDTLVELKIRQALTTKNYSEAEELLKKVTDKNSHYRFYTALIKLNHGQEKLADSLFKEVVNDHYVGIPAYLERLKILYKSEPLSAIVQLNNYLKDSKKDTMKAELYYTFGYFCYHKSDYPEAIKQLSKAKQYDMNRELSARVDILIAESWFAADRTDLALDSFNRYLNLYPEGSAQDRAWFFIAYIHFLNKDYSRSIPGFNKLISSYPDSSYLYDAMYYLGEMDFYLANYNQALTHYLALKKAKPENTVVPLRIAQIYYYQGDYTNSEQYLLQLQPSYEVCILKGGIQLARKDYAAALDQYLLAESFASEHLRKAEAQSYRALCLYQMKRFSEASALYLQLSTEKESPDTYLYLSAKSAYAAKDYHQALQLYDSFIDAHPDSPHFLAALGDIANAYYNMGNYERAVTDWLNILKRFRNTKEFTDTSLASIRDALKGIELGMKRFENQEFIDELLIMPFTFDSEYIQFELNLILVKLYADNEEWADLIVAAEKMRASFPDQKTQDVEMLMVTGLINLNQYSEAGKLLSDIYGSSGSDEALLKWAELEYLSHNFASALAKYRQSYSTNPNADTWLRMLECSAAEGYTDFDTLWYLGAKFKDSIPQSNIIRLSYLYAAQRFDDALSAAESVINNSLSTHDHATAFLTMGLIDIQKENYPAAIATLKRVILLFPEYSDIRKPAIYHTIKAQFLSGATTEAEMLLLQYAQELDSADVEELNELLESVK
jgi:tetratricopeptide (TPR) repeat protein